MSKQKTSQEQIDQQPQNIGKINITNVMLWMMKNAYEQSTTKRVAKELRHLERNCNTTNPEEVKLYIAKKTCSNARKENLIESYAIVIKSLGLKWNQPFYERYDKKRKAPKEELIDFIINHCRMEMATKLSISKDLGQRPIELTWLTIKDIIKFEANVKGGVHVRKTNPKDTKEQIVEHLPMRERIFEDKQLKDNRISLRQLNSIALVTLDALKPLYNAIKQTNT